MCPELRRKARSAATPTRVEPGRLPRTERTRGHGTRIGSTDEPGFHGPIARRCTNRPLIRISAPGAKNFRKHRIPLLKAEKSPRYA